jgi:hypothetical protein
MHHHDAEVGAYLVSSKISKSFITTSLILPSFLYTRLQIHIPATKKRKASDKYHDFSCGNALVFGAN